MLCINNLFKNYDYHNNYIKKNLLENHHDKDNAWIAIDKEVYSIRKDDYYLLDIFKNFYGKNVKDYILNDKYFDIKKRIIILEKLKVRKIGKLL
jgi:hypothetical protein